MTDGPEVPGIDDPVTFTVDDPTDPEAYVRAATRAQASSIVTQTIYGASAIAVDEDGIHVAVGADDLAGDDSRDVYGTSPVEHVQEAIDAAHDGGDE